MFLHFFKFVDFQVFVLTHESGKTKYGINNSFSQQKKKVWLISSFASWIEF